MKESYYYSKLDNNNVQCLLCPHNCILKNEQYGICNSRQNINGTLIATSYCNLCSIGIDPVEKKPLLHFLPGTLTYSISSAGCNFRCLHCQNDGISQFHPNERTSFISTPEQVVDEAKKHSCISISYTYTEPTTFYEFMLDTAKIANGNDLKNICVSNGYINEEPLKELCKYIDAFNIDLKYFSNDLYKSISGGKLNPVLKTLEIIRDNNCWLEITNLIIPDINDKDDLIDEMSKWIVNNGFEKYPLHISRFYPRYKMKEKVWTPMMSVFNAQNISHKNGLKYVYLGNVPDEYNGDSYCHNCKNVILRRENYNLIENNIIDGKCKKCNEKIYGIF